MTANKAVLDYASRNREQLLYNIWLMGKNAIERGNRDSWTITPKVVEAAQSRRRQVHRRAASGARKFERLFHNPAKRDPRGYILPANQPDFLTATKFVNALLGTGVTVHRATADFEVAGKKYPEGSYVVKCAQAFRAHVLDMFEPQDHPNDFAYPGAPPTPPYDMRRLDPGLPDGREVRPHPGRLRRPVRGNQGSGRPAAAGRVDRRRGRRRLFPRARG